MNAIVAKLNSTDYLPPMAFRRNNAIYELVGYVNCLIGCRISKNIEGEALFKSRIKQYLDSHPANTGCQAYYMLIAEYIDLAE